MKTLYWVALLTMLYLYFGYPLAMFLLSLTRRKPPRKEYINPAVSILMPVYNEEEYIEDKIKSMLSVDYPENKVEILIGSDGSTDGTEEIVRKYVNGMVKLYSGEERRGKPSMLNLLTSKAKGEILVFTDVRQELDKDSLKELVGNFYDERVGSVSTELLFEDENNKTGNGIGFYWRYEKFIRDCESKIGSMLGATGAMYAIRRRLFSALPKDLILDDVYIPLKIVEKGYRAIFDTNAKIYDRVAKTSEQEFLRKARTHTGNFQVFGYVKKLFNPLKSPVALQLFSHKLLRLMGPYLLVALFVSNMFLLGNYFYLLSFILQIVFYALALLGVLHKRANRLFDIPHMFCVMNLAAVVGLYRYLTHNHSILWRRAQVAGRI